MIKNIFTIFLLFIIAQNLFSATGSISRVPAESEGVDQATADNLM